MNHRPALPIKPACLLIMFCIGLAYAAAQSLNAPPQQDNRPPLLREVGLDQRLGEQVPLDLSFRDEQGHAVALRQYFGSKPVILNLVYYQCPMLCGEVLNGLSSALSMLKFRVGREFDVLTVSIDPREGPPLASAKKKNILARYGYPDAAAGWHFLTGDQPSIALLTKTVGFRYTYDPKLGQFAHAAGIMVLTPQGRIAQYYYGVEYSPKDLRLGLIEASGNRIGSMVDQLLLYCYHYDPVQGRYGAIVMNIVRLASAATVLILAGFMWLMFRRESRPPRLGTGRAA